MTLTIKQFARMGGKALWEGVSKEERKKRMTKLSKISKKKRADRKRAATEASK